MNKSWFLSTLVVIITILIDATHIFRHNIILPFIILNTTICLTLRTSSELKGQNTGIRTFFLSFFTFPGWLVSLKDTHFAYPLLRQSQISFKIYLRFIVLYATQYVAYLHSFMARLFLQTEWRFEPRTWRSRHWPSSFTIAFLFTRPKTDEYTTDFNVIGL